MQKIIPFLWFNNNLSEAIEFYTAAFRDAVRTDLHKLPDGRTTTGTFRICGLEFHGLNGGPMFSFTPAVSFFVNCDTEQEIDQIWNRLSEGGQALMPLAKYPFSDKYGWVQDKFGLSWQLNLKPNQVKIAPALLYTGEQNGKAEEAINFYMSLFKNASLLRIARYEASEPGTEGTIKNAAFTLDGVEFRAMDSNGPHNFTFTPATSLFVNCNSQEEVDYFWNEFTREGKESRCGWLVDKYGVSWQIIPRELGQLMGDPNPLKSRNVMNAMMKMNKLDIKGLQEAYDKE